VKRRSFLGVVGALSGASITAPARAGTAKAASRDYFALFLDVIRAWKKHDVDGVLAHMADEIVWYAYVGQPPVRGKADVRALLQKLAPTRHAENWRIFHHAVNGTRLFVEGVDDFTTEQDHRVAVPYMGIVEFRDGLITGWRDYFDAGILARMKSGEPVPEAIEPLVSRKGKP
jgi:limonene-1,2-epoxide hydrolase